MIVIGDISGIQDFVFAVPQTGGGQARRLRARSFLLQAAAECAALAVQRKLAWPDESLLFAAASKFALQGPDDPQAEQSLLALRSEIQKALFELSGGILRFSLAWSAGGNPTEQYANAERRLRILKQKPMAQNALDDGRWNPTRLILEPLDHPCELCQRRSASITLRHGDTQFHACQTCRDEFELGRRLPAARWLLIHHQPDEGKINLLEHGISLSDKQPDHSDGLLAAIPLDPQATEGPRLPLARYIPTHQDHTPVEFAELAHRATGDPLLAVLNMDVDLLGAAFAGKLQHGLDAYAELSRRLETFFAITVQNELRSRGSPWANIYTIFSGGDDLLLVGPWNVILDFAKHARDLFENAFAAERLTISAGVALFKPRRPVSTAVREADRALRKAKETRDQCAALGQSWHWGEHDAVTATGKRLARWVEARVANRGWLHTMLALAERRHPPAPAEPDLTATVHLAYHISRNYPKPDAKNPEARAFRQWADLTLEAFDDDANPHTRLLPAALRYALAATRTPQEGE